LSSDPVKAPYVSFSNISNSHCLVLVGSSNLIECDLVRNFLSLQSKQTTIVYTKPQVYNHLILQTGEQQEEEEDTNR